MSRQIIIVLLLSIFVSSSVEGQELPVGKYSTVNPQCFLFASKYITIEADYTFSYHSSSCTHHSIGKGTYEFVAGEYLFTFSPKDSPPHVSSSFQVFNDSNISTNSLKIVIDEGLAKESLIGASVHFLNEENEAVYEMPTDLDGSLDVAKDYLDQSILIRVKYSGYETFDVPVEKVLGNSLNVNLRGTPLGAFSYTLHDFQLIAKKTEQGISIKWPGEDEFRHWRHADHWEDGECY